MRSTDTFGNGSTGTSTRPADDLADVWDALDTLPRATPAADLSATTVELVAARVTRDGGRVAIPTPRLLDRVVPIVAILGGLVLGVFWGRLSTPDPDQRILERLPVIEHLGLLQESGSVGFLEALAAEMKTGQGNGPRWLKVLRDPAELRAEAQEFDAAIQALRDERARDESSHDRIARRRDEVAGLSASDLAALEKSAGMFEDLSAVERRDLERVAAALSDDTRSSLRDAAKLWHIIVAAINPAFRRNIVDMPSEERIEWLTRSAGRFDPRMLSRPREDERAGEWRPPAPRSEGGDDRGVNSRWPGPFQRQPPGPGPQGGPNDRPGDGPRPPPRSPSVRPAAPPRPDAPKEAPSETQAAPR